MRIPIAMTYDEYDRTSKAVKALSRVRRPTPGEYVFYFSVLLLGVMAWKLPDLRIFLCFALFVIVLIRVLRYAQAYLQRRKKMREFLAEQINPYLDIDAQGLSSGHDADVFISVKWAGILRRIELDDALVFLPAPRVFYRIPKKALSPENLQLLRQWSAKVPTGPFPRKTKVPVPATPVAPTIPTPPPPPAPPPSGR